MPMEDAHHHKSAMTHAKLALLSTFKDIPRFPAKPPKFKGLPFFPSREKDHHQPRPTLQPSASAQELRSVDDVEKETVEAVEAAAAASAEDCPVGSDTDTASSKPGTPSMDIHSIVLWKGFFRLWKQKSMRRLSSFPPLGGPRLSRWKTIREHGYGAADALGNDFCFFKPSWRQFTLSELQKATGGFSHENLIGKGGFSEVYEGRLEDGQFVAIKKLTTGTVEERTNNFLAELGILVHIDHPNIAKLIGVGVEGDLHLVLRLSPNGSLSSLLHGPKGGLGWDARCKIAAGTAEGLEYLHERCQKRIIHRDIKAPNILLTEDFEPQICDFGLAKWLPDQLSHHTVSSFEGTFGYLAPEYLTHGVVDEKTDVFAFGVMLLELISGRRALDSSQHSLLMWAKPLIDKGEAEGLVDPALGGSYDRGQLKQLTEVASLCIEQQAMLRPRISEALAMLRGEEEGRSDSPLRRRTYSEELHDASEYNATKYLSDLSRHKQLALDCGDE